MTTEFQGLRKRALPLADFPPRTLVHSASVPRSPALDAAFARAFAATTRQASTWAAKGRAAGAAHPARTRAAEWSRPARRIQSPPRTYPHADIRGHHGGG